MSRFRTVCFGRSRLAAMLTAVMAVVLLGASLAQAEDLSASSQTKPKTTTVPPIVSPRSDQAPEMPQGGPGAVPLAAAPAVVGPAALVVPMTAKAVTLSAPTPVTTPMTPPGSGTGFVAGRSVEVASKRSAKTKTFSNPDGTSTTQVFNQPVHMRDPGSGGWVDINMNLVSVLGGRLHSVATPAAVDLAGRGDDAALARSSLDGSHSVAFSLAGASSAPVTVAGEKATYPGVLPGVDLRLSPRPDGVKEEIVLASKDVPDTFLFPLALQGLTASLDPATGDVVYRDSTGAEEGRTSHGSMKDSKVDPQSNEPAQSFGVTYSLVDDGAGGQALRVTLDRVWLNALERQYPVVVDPSYYWNSTTFENDTYVMSNATADNAWNAELKVGTYDGGTHLAHSFMNFDVSGLNNTHIISAVFNVYETWAWSCQPRGMGVYRVTQGWDGHTMTGYPGASYGEQVAWAAFAMGNEGAGCGDGWASWDITNTVYNWTHEIWGQYGLMMREDSVSTTDNFAWKNFLSWDGCGGGFNWCLPHIDIQFNTPPSVAVPVAPSPGNGAWLHDQPISLAASASDPNGDPLQYYFRVCTGADAESGACWNSGWSGQSRYDNLYFDWNTTWYWHVYSRDGDPAGDPSVDQTNPNYVWWFRPYDAAPAIASTVVPPSPGNGANVHSLTPTLQASSSDGDGDLIWYYFRVCTGADAESGSCVDSGPNWITNSSWTSPTLAWGTTYYWHVYTYDGRIQTNPNWVWSFRPSNSAPAVPTLSSPAAGVTLVQTSLSFSAAATDPDGDALTYQFQVATGPDGQTGRLALSQWISTPTWTPTAGTFADGGSYTWLVRAQDPYGLTSDWSPARAVKIDFRLGQKATLPYDGVGAASVNLSNGNLVVSAPAPSFPTVGGPVGVGFTYNSQAPVVHGLAGDYYQDTNANGILDAGEPRLLHRIDPQLSFDWGSPGSGPNSAVLNPEHWIARWTGAIRVPAGQDGSWVFLSWNSDDALKVTAAGTVVLNATNPGVPYVGTPVTLSSGSSTPLQVDYVQVTGPEYIHLKIRKASDPDTAAFDVPSDWLTPVQPSLPDGWSRTGDGFAQAAYTALRPVNGTAVGATTAIVDASGADHLYSWSGSGWQPPAGENAVLTQRPDGTWTFLGEDGYLYRFSIEGRLTDITSPADDTHPGAATYTYGTPNTGGATRLTRITDATGRKLDLTYGPSTSCPTASGFDASAPADMLCKVAYSDFGGGATELYYSGGHLARQLSYTTDPGTANPKGETLDFGYNADGLLTQIRDVLTNDLIGAGVFADPTADTHKWLVAYDTDPTPTRRKVLSIKAPVADAAMADAARPLRSYAYTPASGLPTQTDVQVAAGNGPGGFARRVVLDGDGHATSDLDAAGVAVDTVWDSANNRPTKKIDHHYPADPTGGLVTTSFYDPAGRLTDTYGPAPAAEFDAQGRSTTAPHPTSAYDETINGLAAAWYPTPDLSGTPALHTTSSLQENWGTTSPGPAIPNDKFSGRLTGEVTLPQAGTLTLAADGGRLAVDDTVLADTWDGPYPAAVNTDKPLSYWRFRETSGTTATDSTGFANGTYTGGVTLGASGNLAAESDTAASFGGVNGNVALPGGLSDFSGGLTIEAWVYPTANANWSRIVDFGNGPEADNIVFTRVGTSNDLMFDVHRGNSPTSVTVPGVLANNVWQHLAVTMTAAGAVTIYKNGAALASGTVTPPNIINRATNYIGRSNWAPDSYFAGKLDEVAIYRSALSAGRISAHAAAAAQTTSAATTTSVTAGTHRLRVDYQELTGTAALQVTSSVAGTTFKPRYNLLTTASDADGKITKHEYLPEIGLETASTADPAGANLRTTTAYETAGVGYYRRTGRTLPAGNATTYAYYGQGTNPATADNPCPGGALGVNQGGALWKTTSPDPDGAGPATARVEESVYDTAGRPVASRVGTEAWTCITYDHRSRVTTKTIPAFDVAPARTITYTSAAFDAAVGVNNPALTTTTENPATGTSPITTKVDWLGRVVSYTDAWADTTTTTYDQAGRVIDTAGPGGTFHTDYDTAGRPTTQKLDGATVATAAYDAAANVLTATSYPTGTGNAGNGTSATLTRDTRGRLAGLTWKKPDLTTLAADSVTRSAGGKVTDQSIDGADPHPGAANFTYDGAGRLTDAWAPGHHDTYSFAASGGCGYQSTAGANTNRTATTDNGGTATTYCYDAADRLTSTSDSRYGSITYDAHGNTKTVGGQTLGYDGVDRHLTTSYGPASAQTTISYTRDATDRFAARTLSAPGTVSFRAATGNNNAGGATTLALSRPGGTQPGDVLLAQVTTAAPTVTVTAPAGWTLQNSTADPASNVRDLLYWRIAATSDPTSWTWTFSSTIKVSGGIGAYAGVNQTNPIDTSAVTTSGSSTTLVAPSVTTTKDNAMVVVLYGTRTGTTLTPPAGMSERYDQASTGQSAATRTTSEAADQAQPAAGVSGTRTATAAASVTASVNRTIALAPAPIVTTVRYGYSGGGDSPDLTLDATNAVVERTFALFGGVSLTKRAGGDVWSYPNIHGDVIATADATGAKQGQTLSYDPYGQALGGLPDNSAGNLDYGWLGQHQRPLEHEGTLATIEMGDRQYLPGLGRFIEVDPIEGGSANNYEYAAGDPVNDLDLDGKMCFVRCGWAKAARKVVTNPIFQVGFVAAACGFGTPVACAIANAGVAAWSSTDRFKRQGINRGTIASAGVDAMFALGRTVTFAPLPRASFVPLSSRLAATGMNAALASMFTIDRMAVGALFGY